MPAGQIHAFDTKHPFGGPHRGTIRVRYAVQSGPVLCRTVFDKDPRARFETYYSPYDCDRPQGGAYTRL